MKARRFSRAAIAVNAALSILLVISYAPVDTTAWSNGGYSSDPSNPDYGTHDVIADRAISIAVHDVSFLRTTYHSRFLLGTEAPDNPAYIGDTRNHHVYYRSSGQLQDDASAVRASQVYAEALSYLRADDPSNAAFYVGAMTHYVADVAVFGHTMGNGTDWGGEIHHSDYESKMNDEAPVHTLPGGIHPSPTDAYNATLQLASKITFGNDTIKPNVWMDSHYDWSDSATFVPSAMISLDAAIESVASVIDELMADYGSAPVSGPGTAAPTDGHPNSNNIIVGLTALAVLAVSGLLMIRMKRNR
jgi:hypothetical protein